MLTMFAHCDQTRTCPACSGTLRAYADTRLLACLACSWAIANWLRYTTADVESFLPSFASEQFARDREEYAALECAYAEWSAGQ